MTTAAQIIDRSMRLIGQIGAGESPTSDEYSDALVALNALISSWNNSGLMCYALREEQISQVASQASYTIGTNGSPSLNTTRPVEIVYAYVRENNYDHPITLIDQEHYSALVAKSSESDWPEWAYYAPTYPNGTLFVYPVPDNSTHKIRIVTRTPIAEFAATSTTVSLPPGWEEALASNLAVNIAPEYETQAKPTVLAMARDSLRGIKQSNSRPVVARHELGALLTRHGRNILTDE